jgi:hypothetical protein
VKTTTLLILFTFIFYTPKTQAKPLNFHFHEGSLQLSDEMFNRYAIPQLRSITTEYFYLLRQLAPDSSELITIREQIYRLKSDSDRWQKDCSGLQNDCPAQVKELLRLARNIDQMVLRHLTNRLSYNVTTNQDLIESTIWLEHTLTQISLLNYRALHLFEQALLLPKSTYLIEGDQLKEINHSIHEMLVLSEISLTALIEPKLRDDFHSLWVSLIKPIEQKVVSPRDKTFFLQRLEAHNTTWNSFHMRMTRGTSDLPRAQQNLVRIMHNRWNSIQRIILR